MQPCWTCKNYLGGCSWSEKFEPVPGWDATPVNRGNGHNRIVSYDIRSCPEYKDDGTRNGTWMDRDGNMEKAKAVLRLHRAGVEVVRIVSMLGITSGKYDRFRQYWKEAGRW